MRIRSLKLTGAALMAAAAWMAIPAQALPYLPVTNFTFSAVSGAPKDDFASVNPTGWSINNTGDAHTPLVFVDGPGTATSSNGGYAVYGPFANPPNGGNFIQADGNPDYDGVFYETITGLTIGQTYQLSFYQASGQQTTFNGQTTEQWIVSLGKNALNTFDFIGEHYYNPDNGADIETSDLMTTTSKGTTPWEEVTIDLKADATTQILSFLAWGDGGSTANNPPTVFLAGINPPPTTVPEPVTLSLFGAGLVGIAMHRRAKNKKKA
jgi:hypothetical protein